MSTTLPLQAEDWTHEIAPYVWGAGMDGTTGLGGVSADVDASFGDILDNLELGLMGMYRGTRDRFSVTIDAVYMGLGATGRGPGDLVKADVDMDQAALEVDLGYEVLEHLTVFGGLRYNDLSVEVETSGPLGRQSVDGDENWVDPVVGALYVLPFAEQWSATFRGDIGGFGIGSDFAWQGLASLRWQASPSFGVLAAYRYISMDYESGSGSKSFTYDMAMSGPALGVVFTF
jgi:hypothetical protein